MKPAPDVSGVPYNSDTIPMWLFPDLWNETKLVRLRGLWFVLLYALSYQVFFGLVSILLSLVFSRPISLMLWFSLITSLPLGGFIGLVSWWEFTRRRKKMLLENERTTSDEQLRK